MFRRFGKKDENGSPEKLRMGLSKTRANLRDRIGNLLSRKTKIDPELLDEMEEILIQSDIGVGTALIIIISFVAVLAGFSLWLLHKGIGIKT